MSENCYDTVPDTNESATATDESESLYPDPVVDDDYDIEGAYFITGERVGGEDAWDPKERSRRFPDELGSDVRHIQPRLADECDVDLEPYIVDEWDGGNRQDE